MAYVVSAIGVPIYLHYCGGELEKVNYVLKGESCCGGEENDSTGADDGCCKDENIYLKNNTDVIHKHSDYQLAKTFSQVFFIALPYSILTPSYNLFATDFYLSPHPVTQQDIVVSTSVLRV